MFMNEQTFTHFATKTQSNSKSTFWFCFKNPSTSFMTFGTLDEVTIPYFTIPVYVNRISSQNGAITTADESGNDVDK